MAKRLLKAAAIINLIGAGFGFLLIQTSIFAVVGMIIAVVRGAIGGTFLYASTRSDENFYKYKNYVLAASIFSLLTFHIISFTLGLISYLHMKALVEVESESVSKRELTEEEKSQKRLRNLLALGCGLVLLAGAIFAVTTWKTLLGTGKTIALICATLMFFAMSHLTEKKFKLKNSSVTYYILANAFCILAFVSAGYFKIFGNWFSLYGEGASLYFSFLWVLIGALSYSAYLKYNEKHIFYVTEFSMFMAIVALLDFANLSERVILFIVSVIVATFALLTSENSVIKKVVNLSKVLLPFISVIAFGKIVMMDIKTGIVLELLTFGVLFIATYCLAIVKKSGFYKIFAPIFALSTASMLIAATSVATDAENRMMFLQLLIIIGIVYIIGLHNKEDKWLFSSTSAICDIGLVYVLFDSIRGFNYYAIVSGVALLGMSLIVSLNDTKFGKYNFEIMLEPVKVILLAYVIYSLSYKFDYTESFLFIALIGFVFSAVSTFRKGFMKLLYFVCGILATMLSVFGNVSGFAPAVQIISLISFGILLLITFKSEHDRIRNCKELVYGLTLFSLALCIVNIFDHIDLVELGVILLTVIYTILFIVFDKNLIFRCFTIVALLIPYVVILPVSVWNSDVNYILYSLPWLALIFVYTRGFLISARQKLVDMVEMVALSIWYLAVISNIAFEVAIFIGIISFISIIIGYRSEKWSSLYYTGILFLIVNAIVQLKDLWASIPVWLYLLISGFILIGMVTYKEYSKVSREENIEKVDAEIIEQPKSEGIGSVRDIRSVAIGSILYLIVIPILLEIIG